MKQFFILSGLFFLLTTSTMGSSGDLYKLLEKIQQAEEQKLPQTALDLASQLEKKSLAEKNKGFYLRAVAKRILNRSHIEGKAPKEKVKILRTEISKLPIEIRPIAQILLAKWFWHYYQQNIYKFASRTQTDGGLDPDDFTTWDLPKIFTEIRALLEAGLKNADDLKKKDLKEYEGAIVRGNIFSEDPLTMYEFALREMLDFMIAGISSLPAPEDKFEIDANSEAFASYANFINYHPKTTDSDSPLLRTISIYQDLLEYYQNAKLTNRFVDGEVNRLAFVYANAFGENKKEIFLKRLGEIEEKFSQYPSSSLASYQIASVYLAEGKLALALTSCEQAIKKHADSDGAILCGNIRANILAPTISVKIDSTINEANSTLNLKYKNIKKIYLRVVTDDWKQYLSRKWRDLDDRLDEKELSKLLAIPPTAEWSVDLEETKDYLEKEIDLKIPQLQNGHYRIFASTERQMEKHDSTSSALHHSSFWRTETMLLVKGMPTDSAGHNKVTGFVLNAKNGTPLSGQKINILQRNNSKEGIYEKIAEVRSDRDGKWEFRPRKNNNWEFYFHLESELGEQVYTNWIDQEYMQEKESDSRVIFFTDRAIYRPGQRIYYKGICYKYDQQTDNYGIKKCRSIPVALYDNNGQEIAKALKSANDFGSFSGDFIAPSNVLTGDMTIQSHAPAGSATFKVEEYKRPKFEVSLETPKKQFRLEENVTIKGSAISYAGAPLMDAKVKYRVMRGVKLPWWWFWANPYSAEQEISHGQVTSNTNGEFLVEFVAKPNKSVNKKFNPSFVYRLEVDVIDSTGETRSATTSVAVGYVAMQIMPSVESWLPANKEMKLSITTTTLDQAKVEASGVVEIHELIGPKEVARRPTNGEQHGWYWYWAMDEKQESKKNSQKKDLSNIENWPQGDVVVTSPFKSSDGQTDVLFKLKAGAYCAIVKSKDQFTNTIEEKVFFTVFPTKDDLDLKIPSLFSIKKNSLSAGDKLEAIWGTGHENTPAYISFIQNGKIIKSYWTERDEQINKIEMPITSQLNGGFTLQVFHVQKNQIYLHNEFINVTRPEKELAVKIETMRSKLRPGEKDTWGLKVSGHKASLLAAELVATMYDASLDAFALASFPSFEGFWNDSLSNNFSSGLFAKSFIPLQNIEMPSGSVYREYPHWEYDIINQFSYLFPYADKYMMLGGRSNVVRAEPADGVYQDKEGSMMEMKQKVVSKSIAPMAADPSTSSPKFEGMMAKNAIEDAATKKPKVEVAIRKNLNETAFFYPHLLTDKKGNVKIEFTMPEALTRWKFMALAHGKKNELGTAMAEVVTQKELMVTPHSPRFLRQGDHLYFTAKVDNLSEEEQRGEIVLELQDASSELEITKKLISNYANLKFTIPAKKSETFSWPLLVPDITTPIIYKVMAIGDKFSDGEEGIMPVLSRTVFVQESIPLWISDKGEKTFTFDKLINSEKSSSLKHEKLVVQMTSNPAWFAVQAIPYLHKGEFECSDYIFERFYANSLGKKIVTSNPKVEKVFKQWRGTAALKSNLQKAENLKRVSLSETPWVQEANSEEKAKNDLGLFFEQNNLQNELAEAYSELEKRALPSGGWPWFPGGTLDHYTTLYLITGFAKLRHLGVDVKMNLANSAVVIIDDWIKSIYDNIPLKYRDANHYTQLIAYYLYGRSFYLAEMPITSKHSEAVDYFRKQARRYWTKLDARLSEADTALGAFRFGDKDITEAIIKSLRERALHSEEMGMYWADEEWAYWWYRAPIEAQARIIELMQEVVKESKEIDQLKVWLLKQKQTQNWKTSRATADVVYTLLLAGSDLLSSDKIVNITMGNSKINPGKIEAGTGFYEKRFTSSEIKAPMGAIKLTKEDKGIAWGGVFWHYFEDISKITPHKTPLNIRKKLFVKRNTKKGPILFPLNALKSGEKISVGETLVVRLELVVDRDMEYVHMKDMRGTGTEPINVLSHWKYQDGLAYYESTKDTASHFFFQYLPKGSYVFEYDLKVFHRGEYQTGMAEIQCLYAPEFSAHSETILLQTQ
ncbi:MAG: hypothetical protein A2504_04435 [Bdellovibrionales bacterium RIFOXYD12_FULL_39_22]|nr:MAG: hypothetical protein A2385_07390 [Bdellovibrionales bacterium RIFOXYB1_FULL_39_21]OFZ42084.1 MAG: hypothetical protein A2485_09360 [Bdellovibrionales bacterium RIFOXYC12_FULL_39_17]OFZ50800.1 MAG: hypothetical protein A2404_06310 [Bdellovibrionales bacterium RIFOXYC1_FULL_39_130]OFZ78023.1 MAG: hypothetical protein A2560_01480 [Bdellovibrionales bacterium RIFOXYD1_FULL_39_84]OFZ93541.1 MAG: hypothetical protein A2504_04435 [Bdellovibrionales bacterium RIFOXYD12_FULL_39_22]HLE10336.1 al